MPISAASDLPAVFSKRARHEAIGRRGAQPTYRCAWGPSGLTIAHNARRTRWEALYISDLVICQVAVIVRSAGTAAAVAAKGASIF